MRTRARLAQLSSAVTKRRVLPVPLRAAHHAIALLASLPLSNLHPTHTSEPFKKSDDAGTTRTSVYTRTARALFNAERHLLKIQFELSWSCHAPDNIERPVPCPSPRCCLPLAAKDFGFLAESSRVSAKPSTCFRRDMLEERRSSSSSSHRVKPLQQGFQVRCVLLVVALQLTS